MGKFQDILLHIILPNRCMFCGKVIEYNAILCPKCNQNKPETDLSRCLICQKNDCICNQQDNGFSKLISPFYYDMGADKAIKDLKFHQNLSNAKKLGYYMAESLNKINSEYEFDAIIPIPMYSEDKKQRGFNQSEKLGEWVSKYTDIPIFNDILQKIRSTKKQHKLTAKDRIENLKDAFIINNPTAISGKNILLIDDVFTTGATMHESSKVLLNAGAKTVFCLTAAKTRHTVK